MNGVRCDTCVVEGVQMRDGLDAAELAYVKQLGLPKKEPDKSKKDRMNHTCEKIERLGYKIVGMWEGSPSLLGLYDRQAHTYIWGVSFCPFCGTELR